MYVGRFFIIIQKYCFQFLFGRGVVVSVYVLKGEVKLGGVCIVQEVGQFFRFIRVVKYVELKVYRCKDYYNIIFRKFYNYVFVFFFKEWCLNGQFFKNIKLFECEGIYIIKFIMN